MSATCVETTVAERSSPTRVEQFVRIHNPDGENIRRYAELTGLPFGVLHLESGMLTGELSGADCELIPTGVLASLGAEDGPHVVPHLESGRLYYSARLFGCRDGSRRAAGRIQLDQPSIPGVGAAQPELLRRLLALAEADVERVHTDPTRELDQLADQLDSAYEEISLFQGILRNLQISLDPSELVNLCVHRLYGTLDSEGCAVLLHPPRNAPGLTVAGKLNADESQIQRLLRKANIADHNWRKPMVRNHLGDIARNAGCPDIRNFVVAVILEGTQPVGWILSVNSQEREEFGTVEASLINSIALILSTHLSNWNLVSEQEDLLLAFVRSLVSSLDAKDSYTRGHSERVARLARRLAAHLGLSAGEQEAVHLSGLLHDIGKIGVEDAILRKSGRLTEAEFRKLQLHPVIGADILAGLQNLQHIIPGVLHHHENYDGTGYPNRLGGDDIPLMARILSVADAYDAMGSDRPYRDGIPLEQVDRILVRGAGTQWDPDVVRAYSTIREEFACLWSDTPGLASLND